MEKKNKELVAAFVAGLAVAGAAAWWLKSENGKEITGKIKNKRDSLLEEVDDIILDARSRFDALKTGLTGRSKPQVKETEDLIM
jgi:hypothetical protein